MAQIAYILLGHKDVESIIAQAERLTGAGDYIAIHYDARSPKADYDRLRAALAGNDRVVFPRRRRKCGWGTWSLVDATLLALRAASAAFPRATHFYLLSGDCMPIKTAEHIRAELAGSDADFIESFDFFRSDWIKTGFREERLIYRHWFNERTRKRLFYLSFEAQKRFGLSRAIPADLKMMIGSQWWCLRRRTVEAVLDFVDRRADVVRFFRTTWIPDETFFQTLVRHLVPGDEIASRTLTFLMFTNYGMPVVFYNDHHDFLLSQPHFFARKISPEATALKSRLGELYGRTGVVFAGRENGSRLYNFLTSRGRIGQRFAPRFWEASANIGAQRVLMVVACKKWHVAKRLLDRVRSVSNLPVVEYLFDEAATPLPDLGGFGTSLEKRARHRRALLHMLFDYHDTDRLLLCLDPSNIDVIRDLYADRCETRLLEIECRYSDGYLAGHARRVGLAGPQTSDETVARLVPTIRNDVKRESEAIRDARFPEYYRMREAASTEENARPLASFLGIEHAAARQIAATDYLFVD